jgi:replicative DNA helicase
VTVPYNSFAEFAVLGTMLADPQAAFGMEVLTEADFAIEGNRLIFTVLAGAVADNRLPLLTVNAPALAMHKIDGQDALQIAMRMVRERLPMEDFAGALQSLKEYSGRRLMLVIAERMTETARTFAAPILAFNEEAISALDDISASMRHSKPTAYDIGEWGNRIIASLKSGKKDNLVPTGLTDLDREIGGWPRGELSIIAGRSSMGKTMIATSALRQAVQKGCRAMFFSKEMPGEKVSARLLSDAVFNSQTPIAYRDIIQQKINPWEIERLERTNERLQGLPLRIDEQSSMTVSEISARTRRYQDELGQKGQRLDVMCVDHLGFIRPSSRYTGNRNLELGEMTKGLKQLAKQLDIAVVLLCQLNREAEKREGRRPQLSDLRESGQIEEDADIVIMAYREAYYLAKDKYDDETKELERIAKLEMMENVVELIGLKHRNGATFSKRFFCHLPSNAVRDAA